MRTVVWTDEKGFKHRSLIQDHDLDDMGRKGIPAGPPDLTKLDWDEIAREINESLVEQGLFTWADLNRSGNGLQQALGALRRRIIALYREYD